MNRLALTICVLGVAAAGFTPVLLYAKQGRSPDAPAVSAAPDSERVTIAVWTPPARDQSTPSMSAPAAVGTPVEAVYMDALPATYEGDYDDPIWAVVTRGARLHADADVSSPTTWFYGVGAKLHVVGYRGGWYQVVDPETSRRGFIYARHYLEALRGPDATPAVAKAPPPPQTALAEPSEAAKPVTPASTQASRVNPLLLAPPETAAPAPAAVRPARPAFAASRPGSVSSLLDQAIRR